MCESKYKRQVQTSVTLFVHHGDDYLFLHRAPDKKVDPNRLNGVGGRVEPGEDYLTAALREAEEETGYVIQLEDVTLSGVVRLEGGYSEDWVMCFFKMEVPHMDIPIGHHTPDGELLWIHKDHVLDCGYDLVDDLHYCFKDVVEGKKQFFINAKVDEFEKVCELSRNDLNVF